MISGFNHNLRHQGILFHVQTEDGGIANPYVVTTVFFQGNVVAQRRRGYEKFTQIPEREEIVRTMMQEQHKEMMKDLVNNRLRGALTVIQSESAKIPAEMKPSAPPPPTAQPATTEAPPAKRTLEMKPTEEGAEKTLDELILEFLNEEQRRTR